jgi:aminoglycoside 6'-N-acetyltransferase I
MQAFIVRQAERQHAPGIATMCARLWPDASIDEHRIEVESLLRIRLSGTLPSTIFISEVADGRLAGFLQVGLRSHADGCDPGHPVGFIEGWFVEEDLRRQGVGAALVHAAEDWARRMGCRDMASDTWSDERNSLKAHQALGYEVVDICVHLRKPL